MNYMKQLNAFKNWIMVNRMPTSAMILWHSLMLVNNATGWKKNFQAQNSVLQVLTGLSKQGVANARSVLVDHGLIIYQKGHVGKAATYQMVSIVKLVDQTRDQAMDAQVDQVHSVDPYVDNVLTIPKQREVEERRRGSDPLSIYQQNFGELKPILRESFFTWCQELGDEVVIGAIKVAAEKGARTYSYLDEILKEWSKANLKTLDQVQTYQLEKKMTTTRQIPSHKKRKQATFDDLRAELRMEGVL